MVDKAHVQHKNELHYERDEQLVMKTQLQAGRLPLGKTAVQEQLENELGARYGGRFSTPSGLGGARLASREFGGDVDGVDEKGPLKSAADSSRMLTGAAFNSGMSMVQGNTASVVGQMVGTEEQAFGDDDSQGRDGRSTGGEIASSESITLGNEGRRASVYELVGRILEESIGAVPVDRQGIAHTFRQEISVDQVRELAQSYPGLEQLDSLPASLKWSTRAAVNWITCAALSYVAIRVDAQKQVASESLMQSDEILRHVSGRFIPAQVERAGKITVDIDPTMFTNGALAA
jgi:hypothetical protein